MFEKALANLVTGLEISYLSGWGMESLTCRRRGELVLFNLVKMSLGGGYGIWIWDEEKLIKQHKMR